jgi:hypothetical protein
MIYPKDTMTAEERLASVINLEEPDRVPVSMMFYYYAPFHTGTPMGQYLNRQDVYMDTMRAVYEDLGPWDIYYNINPINRFIYTYVMMMRALWPGIELPDDSVVITDEVAYLEDGDYDKIIKSTRFSNLFKDMIFRAKMLSRFCVEVKGWSTAPVLAKIIKDTVRQVRFWKKDWKWWKEQGVVIQMGMEAEMPFDTFSLARDVLNFSKDILINGNKIRDAALALSPSHALVSSTIASLTGVPRVQCYLHRTSNSFISPRQFEELAFPSIELILHRLIDRGITPILHCDGDWLKNFKVLRRLPAKKCIIQLDGLTDIFKAKEEIGDHSCIFGDVPAALLATGSVSEVDEYCHRLIEEVGRGGGFILAGGCEIPSNARSENLYTMIHSVQRYGYYSERRSLSEKRAMADISLM